MLTPLYSLLRLCAIAWVVAPYLFRLPSLRGTSHELRLTRGLEQLGPSFIKLGQTLSTRPDVIGKPLADALGTLRDRVTPFSAQHARTIVESELGGPLASHFSAFDPVPIAAASIAQVHRARTVEGRDVAVKILRPRIETAFQRDLDLLTWMARWLQRLAPRMRRLKPLEVVHTLRQSVMLELDLRFEAAANAELAENLKGNIGFRVPEIDWGRTTRRVLVMAWVQGIPLSDVAAIQAAGHDPSAVLTHIAESFFKQALRDGFFHADLHPGNLFVDADGTVAAVDFGIMGRLHLRERIFIAQIFRGFLTQDFAHVAKVHFDAGYVPAHQNIDQFAMACRAIAMPILQKPAHEISVGRLLGQLFQITKTFEMETQPQLILLQKTMVVLEGIGRMLNPHVNMWELARGPIEAWAQEQLSLQGRARAALSHGRTLLAVAPRILRHLEDALTHETYASHTTSHGPKQGG